MLYYYNIYIYLYFMVVYYFCTMCILHILHILYINTIYILRNYAYCIYYLYLIYKRSHIVSALFALAVLYNCQNVLF